MLRLLKSGINIIQATDLREMEGEETLILEQPSNDHQEEPAEQSEPQLPVEKQEVENMNFEEERKTEPQPSPVQQSPKIGAGVSQDFTDIKVESVEDADDVLSHRPKYVEQADYSKVFQEADIKSRQRNLTDDLSSEAKVDGHISRDQSKSSVKITIKDFDIQGVLGEGSFGKVYCAIHKGPKKTYAIKVLDKYHIMKHQKVDSVFRERNLLQELQHPNIIKQYFTFQDDANLYYVFEYASRGSLTKLINKLSMGDNRMPYELVRYYAAEIVSAVAVMHRKNIIHRDLKPENVLVSEDWHLKVIDFGDAIKLEEGQNIQLQDEEEKVQKRKATFVGTPLYVSPEMLSDNISSPSGDIWALGCLIFQMLTGEVPFKAQHDYQTFQLILERKMCFPADMEPEAKNLIDRMLDLNPMNRLGCGRSGTPNDISAVLNHPFFEGIDFQNLQKTKPPIPPTLLTAFNKSGTVKRVNGGHLNKSANDAALGQAAQPPKADIKELRRGQLKKKNEWYMQQTRTFILTSEPRLKYYRNETELRGEVALNRQVYARRSGRDRFEIVTRGRIYHLREVRAGDSDEWISAINQAIDEFCAR